MLDYTLTLTVGDGYGHHFCIQMARFGSCHGTL